MESIREQLRDLKTARPFCPFVIKLASGQELVVRHAELVACSVTGIEMTVYDEAGLHMMDARQVISMTPI